MTASKKIRLNLIAAALVALFCLGIAACTPSAGPATSKQEDASSAQPTATDPYTSDEACLSCHGGAYESIAERTADYGDSNPHDSVHGGYQSCNTCHARGNEVTENRCLDCHAWPREDQSNIKNLGL